jgi:yecA family protein
MQSEPRNILMDFITFNENHPLAEKFQSAYYQLGFICSVQALPETIELEQWLGFLWGGQEGISFDNEQQAIEYAQKILTMVTEIKLLYSQAHPLSELNCSQWLLPNGGVSTSGINFSLGFLAAIEFFNDQWTSVSHHQPTQNMLQTTILLLSKLAPNEEADQALLDLLSQLPETAEILKVLPQLISSLAYNVLFDSNSNIL